MVMSNDPLGSVLASVLFNIFISSIDDGIESTFCTELSGAADPAGGRKTIQRDLVGGNPAYCNWVRTG